MVKKNAKKSGESARARRALYSHDVSADRAHKQTKMLIILILVLALAGVATGLGIALSKRNEEASHPECIRTDGKACLILQDSKCIIALDASEFAKIGDKSLNLFNGKAIVQPVKGEAAVWDFNSDLPTNEEFLDAFAKVLEDSNGSNYVAAFTKTNQGSRIYVMKERINYDNESFARVDDAQILTSASWAVSVNQKPPKKETVSQLCNSQQGTPSTRQMSQLKNLMKIKK